MSYELRISGATSVEREVRDLGAQQRLEIRRQKARPVADALHAWMIAHRVRATDGTALARALDYSLKHLRPPIRRDRLGPAPRAQASAAGVIFSDAWPGTGLGERRATSIGTRHLSLAPEPVRLCELQTLSRPPRHSHARPTRFARSGCQCFSQQKQ
ncbi:transposase [Variovorax sp. SG517]|uniref:IS66 family transposase n=1 Tax=Variovorax sp. SG517 TaxID=2587117 RepID=UPI0035265AEF